MTRDENGRFVSGNPGGPGRPPKEREEKYHEILLSTVSYSDWAAIIKKATEQAKKGDAVARKWLADYLVGQPVSKIETTGADGGPITVIVEYDSGKDSD